MHVRVGGEHSYSVPVVSGIPQGSALGPVLFLIYVNDVVRDISCPVKMFADDIKLYMLFDATNLNSGISSIQENIDKLVRTSEAWGSLSQCVQVCLP